MTRVVVVGGGLAGLATAARLAKLGHQVTLVEQGRALGGALAGISADGFTWDLGPAVVLLPAVLRDLFRKTGRPLETELELEPVELVREHRFADGSTVRLPGGSRGAQRAAVEALGTGLGDHWVRHVDALAADWELMRRDVYERPWDPATGPAAVAQRLATRESVRHRLRAALPDDRLRTLAAFPLTALGQDPARMPAWSAIWPYVEQRFNGWRPVGGMPALARALAARVATRGVDVRLGEPVVDLALRGGRAVGVRCASGVLDAEVVVCACDPRRIPALAPYAGRRRVVRPPAATLLGLDADGLDRPAPQLVLHGRPDLVVHTTGSSVRDGSAWVVHGHSGRGDLVTELARRGLDVRDRLLTRIDLSPDQIAAAASPLAVSWHGRSALRRWWGPRTPVPGVYAVGAHAAPGPGLPFVGLSASLVAQAVGPAG